MRLSAMVLGAIFLLGCGPGWEAYNAKVSELQKTKKQMEENQAKWDKDAVGLQNAIRILNEHNERLKKRLKDLGQDVSKLEAEKGAIGEDLEKHRKQLEELRRAQAAAEARLAQFRSILTKFKAMIDSGKLQVAVRNGKMMVRLPEGILFPSGKADLKPEGQAVIEQVTDILRSVPGRAFQVAGHTDNVPLGRGGRYKSNWELSTARALAVLKVMVERGMEAKRVSAAGYAETDPVDTNDSAEGRAKNRRTEIVLVPSIEELPSLDDLLK